MENNELDLAAAYRSSCALVGARLSTPPQRRTVAAKTEEVRASDKAPSARVVVDVMTPELHGAVSRPRGELYRALKSRGVPHGSSYIVRVEHLQALIDLATKAQQEVRDAVLRHTSNWPDYIAQVQAGVGVMWDPSMVPHSQQEYQDKFQLHFDVGSVPEDMGSIQFVTQLSQEVQEASRQTAYRRLEGLMSTVIEDVHDMCADIAQRTEDVLQYRADMSAQGKASSKRVAATVVRGHVQRLKVLGELALDPTHAAARLVKAVDGVLSKALEEDGNIKEEVLGKIGPVMRQLEAKCKHFLPDTVEA